MMVCCCSRGSTRRKSDKRSHKNLKKDRNKIYRSSRAASSKWPASPAMSDFTVRIIVALPLSLCMLNVICTSFLIATMADKMKRSKVTTERQLSQVIPKFGNDAAVLASPEKSDNIAAAPPMPSSSLSWWKDQLVPLESALQLYLVQKRRSSLDLDEFYALLPKLSLPATSSSIKPTTSSSYADKDLNESETLLLCLLCVASPSLYRLEHSSNKFRLLQIGSVEENRITQLHRLLLLQKQQDIQWSSSKEAQEFRETIREHRQSRSAKRDKENTTVPQSTTTIPKNNNNTPTTTTTTISGSTVEERVRARAQANKRQTKMTTHTSTYQEDNDDFLLRLADALWSFIMSRRRRAGRKPPTTCSTTLCALVKFLTTSQQSRRRRRVILQGLQALQRKFPDWMVWNGKLSPDTTIQFRPVPYHTIRSQLLRRHSSPAIGESHCY